jgi:O-antigen ligase
MHNAFLHVFLQAGFLGGGAIIIALLAVWILTLKHFFLNPPPNKLLVPPEIPGVLLFVTFSSVTESTFAYFSAAWLLSAPIFAYVVALDRNLRKSRAQAAWEKALRRRRVRSNSQDRGSQEEELDSNIAVQKTTPDGKLDGATDPDGVIE